MSHSTSPSGGGEPQASSSASLATRPAPGYDSRSATHFETKIDLPRNLTLTVTHPLTVDQAENLAHVQLLRLWEVLIEMRDQPVRSRYIEWYEMTKEAGFDQEVWVEKVLGSVAVAEEVLRGKWNEPISEEESVAGFKAARGEN